MNDETVLMLNALRLQLFALTMALPSKTFSEDDGRVFREALEQSARLADMAMQASGWKGPVESP